MSHDDLSHRERTVLATLHGHLTGVPAQAPCLTYPEYARAVESLRVKGLCGSESEGEWTSATVPHLRRVWLTAEGRAAAS